MPATSSKTGSASAPGPWLHEVSYPDDEHIGRRFQASGVVRRIKSMGGVGVGVAVDEVLLKLQIQPFRDIEACGHGLIEDMIGRGVGGRGRAADVKTRVIRTD